jgi:ATP-dependent DNA helicase DinG
MFFRENQLSLTLFMLQTMQNHKVALCEAEVGTGKTHAYILAAVIYKLFEGNQYPALLSTSTIALQKAIVEEYLPQISTIIQIQFPEPNYQSIKRWKRVTGVCL